MAGRFDYVKYDTFAAFKQERFKEVFEEAERLGITLLEDGRAKSLFFTALEEAYMWTGKAIRDEQIQRNGAEAHIQERG